CTSDEEDGRRCAVIEEVPAESEQDETDRHEERRGECRTVPGPDHPYRPGARDRKEPGEDADDRELTEPGDQRDGGDLRGRAADGSRIEQVRGDDPERESETRTAHRRGHERDRVSD